MKIRSLVAIVATFTLASCSSIPVAVSVKGNYGTYSVNPDGVVIDIRSAK